MPKEKIKIIDNSGDRKYFTQIPNYIANHSTANDQALYFQMKRYAGENGTCFATQETLTKKLGIGTRAYNKSLKYLLDKGWIKFEGMTKGKTRPIKTYSIVDIWKKNIMEYEEILVETAVSFSKTKKKILVKKQGDTCQKHSKILVESTIEEEPSLIRTIKKRERETPSQEMKLFLKDNSSFKKLIGWFSKTNSIDSSDVILQAKMFRSYWSELNASGKKQKWQLEKTFELKRRFGTWMRRAESFGDFKGKVAVKKY